MTADITVSVVGVQPSAPQVPKVTAPLESVEGNADSFDNNLEFSVSNLWEAARCLQTVFGVIQERTRSELSTAYSDVHATLERLSRPTSDHVSVAESAQAGKLEELEGIQSTVLLETAVLLLQKLSDGMCRKVAPHMLLPHM
jgi:hypothetical protein